MCEIRLRFELKEKELQGLHRQRGRACAGQRELRTVISKQAGNAQLGHRELLSREEGASAA